MKKLFMIPLLLILIVAAGCEQKQIITQLEVGKKKLLGAGLVLEAVENLKKAEIEEGNKTEARALLVIAYAHGISTDVARWKDPALEVEYKKQREQRIAALNESEMKVIFRVLNERHRVQHDARQVLIDKGSEVVPLILENLIKKRYINLQTEFAEMLIEIGSKGLPQILETVRDPNTPINANHTLIWLIGEIGDLSAISPLESIRSSSSTSSGLKMEIYTTLYRLGEKDYQKEIVAGLRDADVRARRAAAKAMVHLNEFPTEEVVEALKDSDNRVCQYAAEALQKFPAEKAVDPLVDVLKSDVGHEAKQATVVALETHVEKGLGPGLSVRLIDDLSSGQITDPENRLRFVQLLKKGAMQKQIKRFPEDMNLEWKIWDYRQTKEDNDMVKDELDYLLTELGSK